jgi:hypothetical protein
VCSLMPPLALRNFAHGKTDRHRGSIQDFLRLADLGKQASRESFSHVSMKSREKVRDIPKKLD